ncbi:hypothetical protein HanRHA438_Chr17g0795141 [Helianthus annuus]|nr:hypothetical protein HanRHA438_Chr17g0795141 [Helianthus annuus]
MMYKMNITGLRLLSMMASSTPSPTGAGITPSRPPPSHLSSVPVFNVGILTLRTIQMVGPPSLSGVLSVTPFPPPSVFVPSPSSPPVTIPNSLI